MDTYWQSDGMQPHLIDIQFARKMTVMEVALYLDYKLDESYTPKKIAIRSGSTVHDLKEIHVQHVAEPNGWISLPLRTGEGSEQVRFLLLLRCAMIDKLERRSKTAKLLVHCLRS